MAVMPQDTADQPLFTALAAHGVAAMPPATAARDGESRALTRALFNGAVRSLPLALVPCADEAAIRTVLRLAADHGTPVSVCAGGHDLSGRSFDPENLVLDLGGLNHVHVDPARDEVTLGGGALTRDLLAALPEDRVTATGTVLTVGMTGATLGGGYGRLTPGFGLSADCLLRARVVLADGSVVIASEAEDADLLWALRGGGTGFGVVTALTMALHTLPRVLSALILYPPSEAGSLLLAAQDLIDRHPDALSLFMGFMTAPTGDVMLFVAPMWWGDGPEGEGVVDGLTQRPGAFVLETGWRPYRATFSAESEKAWPKGRHYHLPTRTVRRIDGHVAEILVAGARGMTSPNSAIVLHDFHGAPTRIAPGATAFPLREDHFVVEIIAAWDDPTAELAADGLRHRAWADDLSGALAPVSLPGGYVNLLPPDEAERVRLFYGPSADRLHATKRCVDPHDLFRSAIGRLPAVR
ncbi:MAG: FAD-binding protein [Parafilimonas terrae]|nr:FAD-binding protein [Parafilimonas terrae]